VKMFEKSGQNGFFAVCPLFSDRLLVNVIMGPDFIDIARNY